MAREKLEKILKQVADAEEIRNYEIYPNLDALNGNGFASAFYTGDVVDKDTGLKIQTYIKVPPLLDVFTVSLVFSNEYQFYANIFPKLDTFQKNKGVKNPFHNIAKFYCGSNKSNEQYVALENLKIQSYDMFDKREFLNENILRHIFELYGKFHALSFAFKDQNLEGYSKLVAPLKDAFTQDEKNTFFMIIKRNFTTAYMVLNDIDPEVAKKIQPYVEQFQDNYVKYMTYNGNYSALSHGDCWSNNLLFKYREDGTIGDIKFIDFQLCRDSTPIHDLSYFFYSGASKEDFKKLDEYLELYHKSFSAFARELGSDPEKLLPLNILKAEWKQHSLFGIFLSMLVWQIKLMHRDQIEAMITGKSGDELQNIVKLILESDTFRKNTTDILRHAVEYGIM